MRVMKFISLFRRNHNQGSSPAEGVRPYQQPPVTMESAVFPPNKQETEKLQQQQQQQHQPPKPPQQQLSPPQKQQPSTQQQQHTQHRHQERPPQEPAMDVRGAAAVGLSCTSAVDEPPVNVARYIEELDRLRVEVELLKVKRLLH